MTFALGTDLFPMLAGALAAMTCGLLGNFLVLRRLSLMGDAISHAVLPGLVIAFLLSTSRSPLFMFLGAAAAGLATVVLVEVVKKLGRVEPGAAMGVVFSVLFALGVLLIEQAAARQVDLDADCVLYGQLETLVWFGAPDSWAGVFSLETLRAMPRQVTLLLIMFAASLVFVGLLFKELRIAAFDPGLATTQGVNATVMHYVLMVFVAAATVAAFEAVGSILVIAMLVCPAVTARLLTNRLGPQLAVSLLAALASGVLGYMAATMVPAWVGGPSVNAAGSMTLVAGGLVVTAALLSPTHGLVARVLRRRSLARRSALDDLLADLLRRREGGAHDVAVTDLAPRPGLLAPGQSVGIAGRLGLVDVANGLVELTEDGLRRARHVLRRHRLWESYLVEDASLRADHVHDTAEQLEHLPVEPRGEPVVDPHGRPIYPPEDPGENT